jgi:hypothetical protein
VWDGHDRSPFVRIARTLRPLIDPSVRFDPTQQNKETRSRPYDPIIS